jgi:hypothetical protein
MVRNVTEAGLIDPCSEAEASAVKQPGVAAM